MPSQTWSSMIFDHPVDHARLMKVICIGAGIAGIITGIRFPQEIENLDLVIYEKNTDVGGTWFENRYPGIRCDIPSPGYQLTFESNTQWSEFYASGPEIQAYLVEVAKKYGVYKYVKFRHLFKGAVWHQEEGKWECSFENLATGELLVDTADVVLTATEILNRWKFPDIQGLDTFKGQKVHTADWDESIKLEGLEVALIGAGSSGVQILPTIQPICKRIDHYVKGKNWIPTFTLAAEELRARGATGGNFTHPKEELQRFKDNPEEYMAFRHKIEESLNRGQEATFMGTQAQKDFGAMALAQMQDQLKTRPDILEALLPDFPPGCRRLTLGPKYLASCCKENVDYVSTPIKRVVPEGIETEDGKIRKVDLIICATGFDVSRQGELPFTGQDSTTIDELWDPIPEAYLSVCSPKMPNLFFYLGPNGGPGAGSTIHMLEWVCDYMVKCVKKMQREYIKSMVVKAEPNKAFSKHVDKYFAKTVFSQNCKSWYKRGKADGRLIAPWPGSGVHARKALDSPRFEDFEYEKFPETEENMLAWLGNGMTVGQVENTITTEYLDTVKKPKPIHPEISTAIFIDQDYLTLL